MIEAYLLYVVRIYSSLLKIQSANPKKIYCIDTGLRNAMFVELKDMMVINLWNTGEKLPVETLSGGESLLVSLSLVLALSEQSSGRSKLESLFLDEGFGTLDSETLDAALNALESLRLSGRTIGVISHIDQISRRIPVGIDVKRTGVGTSTIHVKG